MADSKKSLRIGWIIPTVGIFGAVREMVEVSNSLVERGHTVSIFHPDGGPCVWLPCSATCKTLTKVSSAKLDVMIGIVDWDSSLYSILLQSLAPVKAICVLGFTPSDTMAQALQGKIAPEDKAQKTILDSVKRKLTIMTDSAWQIEWLQEVMGYPIGPSFGGINTDMFKPADQPPNNKKKRILFSNDPRTRKGTDTVEEAITLLREKYGESIEFDSYWDKRFSQAQLVSFLQDGDIFLDGHRRAGWCNPVAEAMACGAVPVCTDIGAVKEFAEDGETAFVVPVDDSVQMAERAGRLLENESMRATMRDKGFRKTKSLSYRGVAERVEKYLNEKLVALTEGSGQ